MKRHFFNLSFTMIVLITMAIQSIGQTYTQPAKVISLGGKSCTSGIYSHFCVIGEPVVQYNITAGQYSGSIGFLPNAGGNLPPVALLVINSIEVPMYASVTLDGTPSYDPDNDGITYKWIAPEGITIQNPTLPVVIFTAPTVNYQRTFEVSLVVSDGMLSDTAWATVVVKNPQWNVVIYTQSTICIGLVTLDCTPATADYIVGAFVNNECRGVTDVFTYQENAYVSFLIQGDVSNEQVTFRMVNKVTDELFFVPDNSLARTNPGGNLGTFQSPFPIPAYQILNSQIGISSGWSGISSTFAPLDKNIVNMFLPVQNNLTILYDFGGVYYPAGNTNTLVNWSREKGYVIKMTSSSSLDFAGYKPCSNSLTLPLNWSIMPVLSACQVSIASLFAGQAPIIIKEVAGTKIYWPAMAIYTLSTLVNGKAYYVKMASSASITFPLCPKSSQNSNGEIQQNIIETLWGELVTKPNSHVVVLKSEALGQFQVGDFIGAFNQDGNLFGYLEIDNPGSNQVLVLFGDDGTTESVDGFIDGENITLRYLSSTDNVESILEATYDESLPQNDGTFTTNGMSAINLLKATSNGTAKIGNSHIEVYPNPAHDKLFIKVGSQVPCVVTIINAQGQVEMVENIVQQINPVNIGQLKTGLYLVMVSGNSFSFTTRIIVIN